MTVVIEPHPLFAAITFWGIIALLLPGSIGLMAYCLRQLRSKKLDRDLMGLGTCGVIITVGGVLFAGHRLGSDPSPWAVEFTGNTVELKCLRSTRRIELSDIDRVEFERRPVGARFRERES